MYTSSENDTALGHQMSVVGGKTWGKLELYTSSENHTALGHQMSLTGG